MSKSISRKGRPSLGDNLRDDQRLDSFIDEGAEEYHHIMRTGSVQRSADAAFCKQYGTNTLSLSSYTTCCGQSSVA